MSVISPGVLSRSRFFHSPILFRESNPAALIASLFAKGKSKNGVPHILESHPRERRARMGHPLHGSTRQKPKREGWATRPVSLMRQAADEEDAVEKLPITPGPIVPAREQLGSLLLEQNHPELALKEFQATLANAPSRLGATRGAAQAAELLKGKTARVAAVE